MDELQIIQSKIYEIRGERVMLDRDIAALYNVETKVLNQAVKRNIKRFPEDFMFQLSKTEFQIWKSQIVTSNSDKKGLRRPPYAFTEQGVAYLITICDDIKEATGLFFIVLDNYWGDLRDLSKDGAFVHTSWRRNGVFSWNLPKFVVTLHQQKISNSIIIDSFFFIRLVLVN